MNMPDDDFFTKLENDDEDDRIIASVMKNDSDNPAPGKKRNREKMQNDDDICKFMTIISYIIAGIGLLFVMAGNYETGFKILFFGPLCLVAVFCISCLFYYLIKGVAEAVSKNHSINKLRR